MNGIPVPGTQTLTWVARRTLLVRAVLAAMLIVLVLMVALALRRPAVRFPSALPVRSGDMVVLDLSASISSDTFSRIGETLRKLVATGGRYGLVVFSNLAYEALPPGTPASALRPLIRYFTVPSTLTPGVASAIPTNPWANSFTSGTNISTGLDLAHRILLADHLRRSRVILISDLGDSPDDLQRLNQVVTTEYGPGRTQLRVIAIDADPNDEAFFQHLGNAAITDAQPTPQKPTPPPAISPGALPLGPILGIVVTLTILAAHSLWSARLRWDTTPLDRHHG